jgi:hypothetical protein
VGDTNKNDGSAFIIWKINAFACLSSAHAVQDTSIAILYMRFILFYFLQFALLLEKLCLQFLFYF